MRELTRKIYLRLIKLTIYRSGLKWLQLPYSRVEKLLYAHGTLSSKGLCLPDFLGIGAPRSGTSWLYMNLRCHPELYLPDQKELHYFDRNFHKSLGFYSGKFKPGRQKVKGEITPAYGHLPVEIIRFIRTIMPDVKLVYLMRNPIDRAWSSALKGLVRKANRKFEDVDESEFYAHFRSEGNRKRCDHLTNLNNWLNIFPSEQLYIGFFEDIVNRPQELLNEIFAHIGVSRDVDWNSFPGDRVINKGPGVPMPQKYRDFLEEMYCQDIEALYELFGDPIARWRCS